MPGCSTFALKKKAASVLHKGHRRQKAEEVTETEGDQRCGNCHVVLAPGGGGAGSAETGRTETTD